MRWTLDDLLDLDEDVYNLLVEEVQKELKAMERP